MTGFFESLYLGRIGASAQEEFFVELEEQLPEALDNEMDPKQLANLNIGE